MITVELGRASTYGETPPDPAARSETRLVTARCGCETLDDVRNHPHAASWFYALGTVNHRETETGTAMDRHKTVWLIDVESIEHAFERWGAIVIDKSDVVGIKYLITIYDDYLE